MWPCQAVDGELPAPDSCGANICWFCNLRHAASARSLVVEAPPTETEQAGFRTFWTQALRFGLLRSVWGMAKRLRTRRCPAFRRYIFQVFVFCYVALSGSDRLAAGCRWPWHYCQVESRDGLGALTAWYVRCPLYIAIVQDGVDKVHAMVSTMFQALFHTRVLAFLHCNKTSRCRDRYLLSKLRARGRRTNVRPQMFAFLIFCCALFHCPLCAEVLEPEPPLPPPADPPPNESAQDGEVLKKAFRYIYIYIHVYGHICACVCTWSGP